MFATGVPYRAAGARYDVQVAQGSAAVDRYVDFEGINPAWQRTLGWTPVDMADLSLFDLLHPDDVDATRECVDRLNQGAPAVSFTNRYRCKDGRYRWLSWRGLPDRGGHDDSARDITSEVESAKALEASQDALRQAQKMVGPAVATLAEVHTRAVALFARNQSVVVDARRPFDRHDVKRPTSCACQGDSSTFAVCPGCTTTR